MKIIITSNSRSLRRALCTLLLGIAGLWAMPRSANAQQLYVGQYDVTNTVGEYSATTGAVNTNFSTITGLNGPAGLALSGNDLFVANYGGGSGTTVGEYDATTGGAAINPSFITGLNDPWGLVLSGNDLFVSNAGGTTVGEYNATTGAAIKASFITGLSAPTGLLVTPVPEPSPCSMIAVGGAALLGIMLRKRQRTA
jgi:hypothetical protein